jgi:hypothetical protein
MAKTKNIKENSSSSSESVVTVSKRRAGHFIASAFLSVVASAAGLVPYVSIFLISIHVFDNGIGGINFYYILWVALASLFAAILKAITLGISLHVSHIGAYDVLYELRIEIAKRLG